MKTPKLLVSAIVLFSLLAGFASAQGDTRGCCLNALTFVCQGQQVSQALCCPDDPSYYGPAGAPDKATCIRDYFKPGQSCAELEACELGCCCDPNPSMKPAPACRLGNWTAKRDIDGICDRLFCQRILPPEPELPETLTCSNPFPQVTARGVKGEKAVNLLLSSQCDIKPSYYIIKRADSPGGTRQVLNPEFHGTSFSDYSSSLRWGNNYYYYVTAVYVLRGGNRQSYETPVAIQYQMGDLPCWGIYHEEPFCISPNYFFEEKLDRPNFADYFRTVLGITREQVDQIYGGYYNNAWTCNADNRATLHTDCSTRGRACVITRTGPMCYILDECLGVNPFGLFTTERSQCEGSGTDKKYCFFDSSVTVVPKCYKCHPEMECYDYKSKEACEADNCRANGRNNCTWRWVNEELGVGVCKSEGKENCKFCSSAGTGKVESYTAHNHIFNRCTQQKLDALAVSMFPCGVVGSEECTNMLCEKIKEQSKCSAPVRLNGLNAITSGSSLCGGEIKVCTWYQPWGSCMKDANGDNNPDCAQNNENCQKDRFPPRTELRAYAQLTTNDNLTFVIYDKRDSQGAELPKRLQDNYTLYICGYKEGDPECGPQGYNGLFSNPSSYFKATSLSIPISELLTSGVLAFGMNTLKFFAVDPSKNVEVVQYQRLKVSPTMVDGIGVFMLSPRNNSWVNNRTTNFRVYAQSDLYAIHKLVMKWANGETAATFYEGSPVNRVIDQTRPISLGQDGVKNLIIEVRAGTLVREVPVRVMLDTVPPAAPVLRPVQPYLAQNFILVSGTAEPGSTVKLYAKLGAGQFEEVGSVNVPQSGNFTHKIMLVQGDYRIKARAFDLANNPSPWSNELAFAFVSSAPSFTVNPPEGAVRANVPNISIAFQLISQSVQVDRDATFVKLYKEGSEVAGRSEWAENANVLYFFPSEALETGEYAVFVRSVDVLNNSLEGLVNFRVLRGAPIITTSWESNQFKTRIIQQQVRGRVNGGQVRVTSAYYTLQNRNNAGNIRVPIVPSSQLPAIAKDFDVTITLVEGENTVVFRAVNELGSEAVEPYKIIVDIRGPGTPGFGFR